MLDKNWQFELEEYIKQGEPGRAEKNSWYFRNALVRANYNNIQKGIHSTTKFLEMVFSIFC